MTYYRVGELVVYRYSRASTLKGKIYKVAECVTGMSRVRVVSPSGRSKDFNSYFLETLDEHQRHLANNVNWAERREVDAQKNTEAARSKLRSFSNEKDYAEKLFKV